MTDLDQLAMETAFQIILLDKDEFLGGEHQKQARIQCLIAEALKRIKKDQTDLALEVSVMEERAKSYEKGAKKMQEERNIWADKYDALKDHVIDLTKQKRELAKRLERTLIEEAILRQEQREKPPVADPLAHNPKGIWIGATVEVHNKPHYHIEYGHEVLGKLVTVQALFFSEGNIPMAAVEHDGRCYCFRQEMLKVQYS